MFVTVGQQVIKAVCRCFFLFTELTIALARPLISPGSVSEDGRDIGGQTRSCSCCRCDDSGILVYRPHGIFLALVRLSRSVTEIRLLGRCCCGAFMADAGGAGWSRRLWCLCCIFWSSLFCLRQGTIVIDKGRVTG